MKKTMNNNIELCPFCDNESLSYWLEHVNEHTGLLLVKCWICEVRHSMKIPCPTRFHVFASRDDHLILYLDLKKRHSESMWIMRAFRRLIAKLRQEE